MSVTIWFLLGELLCVSILVLAILVIARWRKRNRLIGELGNLLERVNRAELDRQTRLQERLVEPFGLDEDDAESLSLEIIRAERNFFKIFTEIQIGAASHDVNVFDKSLYALLDCYWELLARDRPNPKSMPTADPVADIGEDFPVGMEDHLSSENGSDSISDESPDAIDTSGFDLDTEFAGITDDCGEPTWDEAFAEAAGDDSQPSAESGDEKFEEKPDE